MPVLVPQAELPDASETKGAATAALASLDSNGQASDRAKAIPPEPTRVGYLDGWRGLAILLVLQAHFFRIDGFDSGRLGVDVFFCLSGFLMSGILFIKRTPLKLFYIRRASRILPAFVVFSLSVFIWCAVTKGIHPFDELGATLLFLRTYLPTSPGIWSSELPIQHIWSLNVEEHSYMFLSLIAFLGLASRPNALFVVLCGLTTIAIGIAYVKFPAISSPNAGLRTEVAASYLLLSAGYCLVRNHYRYQVPPVVPLVTFVLAAMCYCDFALWWVRLIFSPLLLAFTVNHLRDAAGWVLRLLDFKLLRWFGICSYSIYLWQQPFYRSVESIPGARATALGLAILVGAVSFYLLEDPARKWINERYGQRRALAKLPVVRT